MPEIKLGKQKVQFTPERREVVLCDTADHARATARQLAKAIGPLIDASDDSRGTVRDRLGRKPEISRIAATLAELHLDESMLDWRMKDATPLQRVLAASFVAVFGGAEAVVVDCTSLASSRFDTAHLFAHLRRLAASFPVTVVAVISDAALMSSAGSHLTVISDDIIVEAASVSDALARPASAALLERLEATPVASPLAMQKRRVQRSATKPVNYAHTLIIELPTADSIALAAGDTEN